MCHCLKKWRRSNGDIDILQTLIVENYEKI